MGDRPDDAADVAKVLRFGWAITELRGRYTQGIAKQSRPPGEEQVIPLKWERSRHERAIEVEKTVTSLATELEFDKLKVTGQYGPDSAPLEKLAERTRAIAGTGDDLKDQQEALVTFLRLWDEAIQDEVVAHSPSFDSAYQLSRGLADIRWANDLTIDGPIDPLIWTFYLAEERRDQLTQRLHRLADYFDPLAIHAMAASLWAWGQVAHNESFRTNNSDVKHALTSQADIWRDLLIAGLPAQSMLTPEDIVKSVGVVWPILQKYQWTVLAILFGAIVTAAGVALVVANGDAVNRAIGGFLAAFGVIGITVSGIAARAKDAANGLLDQMRKALYADLVAAAATVLPTKARGNIKRERRGRDLRN